MAIRASQANLPPAPKQAARLPTRDPIIVERLAEVWMQERIDQGYTEFGNAIPEAGAYRASLSSKRCDRALSYALADIPESNPMTVADYWRLWLGSTVHARVQSSLRSLGDGWIPEINVDLNPIGIAGSAHADLVRFVDVNGEPFELDTSRMVLDDEGRPKVDKDGQLIYEYAYKTSLVATGLLAVGQWLPGVMVPTDTLELKSINGYSYKMTATNFKGNASGARYGHIVQGALVAVALNVERYGVAYLSLELVGPDLAAAYSDSEVGRFACEWHYDMDRMRALVEREAKRISNVDKMLGSGHLVTREIHDPELPVGAIVQNPKAKPGSGMWTQLIDGKVNQTGSTWMCAYCPHRDICAKHGSGLDTAKPAPADELPVSDPVSITAHGQELIEAGEWDPGFPPQDT